MNQEENKCDFCGQVKPVGRVYVYAGNKEKILEKDRNANYFTFVFYCLDCGEPYLPELTSNHQ